jgi:hypothetical protein
MVLVGGRLVSKTKPDVSLSEFSYLFSKWAAAAVLFTTQTVTITELEPKASSGPF